MHCSNTRTMTVPCSEKQQEEVEEQQERLIDLSFSPPEAFPRHASSTKEWLTGLNLERYHEQFQGVDVQSLPSVSNMQLLTMGIRVPGHRKRLLLGAAYLSPPPSSFSSCSSSLGSTPNRAADRVPTAKFWRREDRIL